MPLLRSFYLLINGIALPVAGQEVRKNTAKRQERPKQG
jgi:hypothetical protein